MELAPVLLKKFVRTSIKHTNNWRKESQIFCKIKPGLIGRVSVMRGTIDRYQKM